MTSKEALNLLVKNMNHYDAAILLSKQFRNLSQPAVDTVCARYNIPFTFQKMGNKTVMLFGTVPVHTAKSVMKFYDELVKRNTNPEAVPILSAMKTERNASLRKLTDLCFKQYDSNKEVLQCKREYAGIVGMASLLFQTSQKRVGEFTAAAVILGWDSD